jgi:hypothetical protein
VPDLASTCPDAAKRAELLAVHREAFTPDGKSKVLLVLLLMLLLPLLLLPLLLLPLLSHCCALSSHPPWQHILGCCLLKLGSSYMTAIVAPAGQGQVGASRGRGSGGAPGGAAQQLAVRLLHAGERSLCPGLRGLRAAAAWA